MTSTRIAIASLLAAAAVLAGGAIAQHDAVSHATVVASPVHCCDDAVSTITV
jgi:hypothetical protein